MKLNRRTWKNVDQADKAETPNRKQRRFLAAFERKLNEQEDPTCSEQS